MTARTPPDWYVAALLENAADLLGHPAVPPTAIELALLVARLREAAGELRDMDRR